MNTVQDVVKQLCILGIRGIEVEWDSDEGMLRYDLKTHAKSHLHLYEDFSVKGRYDYTTQIDPDQALDFIIKDLFWEFKGCIHGRDFYSSEWMELAVKLGLVEKKVTTHTTTEYV
jgi:hypothetical protein